MKLQQFGRLFAGEGEFRAADLRQVAGRPVAVQRQQWLGAGDEDQAQAAAGVAQHELELLGDLRVGDLVVLVEDDDDRPVQGAQPGGQACEQRRRRPARVGRAADGGGQGRAGRAQGLEQVRPEHARLLSRRIGGEPGDGRLARCGPVGHQQRLARPGRAVDHGQGRLQGPVEMADQPLAPQKCHRAGRYDEPRAQKRIPLGIRVRRRPLGVALLGLAHGAHRPWS